MKRQQRRKILVYGLLILFMLSISGVAWAAPADTTSTEKKSNEALPASLFKDVQAGDSNLIYINYLAKKTIISGFPDGGFHPTEGLSRAQAATVMVKAAGLSSSDKKSTFKDVSAGHWAAGNIAAATAAGYIKGYPDGTYRPEAKLSRAEGISLVLSLSKQKDSGVELPVLKDLDSKHWAARSVAIGLAAGMVGLTSDKTQFLPDDSFSRGDLSRALAVLLTTDPDLSQVPLNGSLEIKKGEVKVNDKVVSGSVSVKAGDQITTATGAEAQLGYPDGSGLLVKENSQLAIKEARGRAYIKQDGSLGTAVDWLLVDLKKGDVFGALATNPNVQSSTEKKTAALGEHLMASLAGSLGFLAANDKELPWYQTANSKKVKVKVDMPYGVAAVRGSFWNNLVTANGCSTSLLEGEAELSAGGRTESLPPGRSSSVSASNPLPTPPAPMSVAQVNAWVQQANWLQNVAQTMQAQQAALQAPVGITAPNQTPAVIPPIVVPNILNTLNQALTQVQQAAGITDIRTLNGSNTGTGAQTTPTTSGGGGTTSTEESSSSRPAAGWRLEDVATTVYNNQTVALTRNLYITPPAGVPSGSYYDVRMKNGSSEYPLGGTHLGNPILHLANASQDISKLFVVFRDGNGNRNGIYSLTGSGSSGTLSNLATKTISGKIDLDSSSGPIVAPAGGLIIKVKASGYSIGGDFSSIQSVTMPAGASTVNYTLNVPDNYDSISNYSVYCNVDDSSFTNPYTGSYGQAVNVLGGNVSDINMVIRPGKYISGTISLPGVNTSNSRVYGNIWAHSTSMPNSSSSAYFSIAPGESSSEYHLPVAPGQSYTVGYYLIHRNSYINEQQCYPEGYYSSSGTVTSQGSAAAIPVTDNVSGINLTMQTGYGYLISGNIKLPGTDVAPVGGIELGSLYVDAQSGGMTHTTWQNFSSGMSSVGYIASVPSPGTYTFGINQYGGYGSKPGYTYPALYKLEPVVVTVYSANVTQDLNLTAVGSAIGSTIGLSPDIVSGPALLLGGTAYGLGSAQYTTEAAGKASYLSWYFKSDNGKWFNLRNFGTAAAWTTASETAASDVALIGLISGSPELTPGSSSCSAGCSVSVTAPSGSNLWASGDTVKAILMSENNGVVPGGPITPDSIGNGTATIGIPSGIVAGNYVLTLYKELGGVPSLLGAARFYITNPI